MGVSEPVEPTPEQAPTEPVQEPTPDPRPVDPTPVPEPSPPESPSPAEEAPASELTADDLVAQHTKDTLAAAASVAGVEVASGDTKADIAEKLVDAPTVAAATPEELVAEHKKDELVAAATVAGVEVASSDTKADIAEKLVPPVEPASAQPVRVDNMTRRSDSDALEGLFCDIVAGEHAGRTGVFDKVLEYDRQTGYPTRILVITRDADNLMLPVAYDDVRPSASTGSRS